MGTMPEDDSAIRYAGSLIRRATQPRFFRELEERDGYARLVGDCGDVVEFMLRLAPDHVTAADVAYQTIGCMAMIASCDVAAELAEGRSLDEVCTITPEQVIKTLGGVPEQKYHCTELAVRTLREAVADAQAHAAAT